MDRAEREKIYTLLGKFYPHAKTLQDREALTAWGMVLEDFTYDDVKASVLRYAAGNKYFPDIADLTVGLRRISDAKEQESARSDHKWMRKYIDASYQRKVKELHNG